MIILLYFHTSFYKADDTAHFESLLSRITLQAKNAIHLEAMIINDIFIVIMDVFIYHNQYHRLLPLINSSKSLIERNKFFHNRPIIYMFEGKFYLFAQNSLEKAKRKYLNGIKSAEYLGDAPLSKQIRQEWENDLKAFTT
jgi:hypothetical protein